LFASISAEVWHHHGGPLQGANRSGNAEEIHKKNGGDIDAYMAKAKDKDDSFRLMGFGHRVYVLILEHRS
jgi:citrate synthase